MALSCLLAPAQTSVLDVGSGAPSAATTGSFVAAYFRNNFYLQLSLPPLGAVKKFGTAGLLQEFADAAKTAGVKFALIKPNTAVQANDGSDVFQSTGIVYAYYSTVGVTTAGQPTTDTVNCADGSCQYQSFDKNYVLFSYLLAGANGQNFTLRDPFYTKWNALGGISSLGAANSAEQASTSFVSNAAATVQTYQKGALYNITSGVRAGRLVSIGYPVYDLYVANGAHTGFLGYPTGEAITLSGGGHRQTFEGGSVDYSDTSGPMLRLPVNSVAISSGGTSVRLNLNDTFTARASTFGANGNEFTDRSITFVTTNGRVISVQQTGASAVLRAVGGGFATVTAVSEGKISPAITFFITAPCCQIGEGAPSAASQQSFQDAVTRSRISVRLPAPSPVRRAGAGLVQDLQGVDPNATARYLVTLADKVAVGYVVAGEVLSKYEQQGGPLQALGYPIADAAFDAAHIGRQIFENGAIAGSPARVISGAFLRKWASLNYEAGAAGQPTGDVDSFLTFSGTSGLAQTFQNGALYGANSGPQTGKVFFVTGLIAAKYSSLGAARSELGLPTADESSSSGKRHQDFEGGSIEYGAGDAEAQVTLRSRKPSVTALPAIVAAGGRVRVTIAGFPNGGSIRVFITGQADFLVKAPTGSYFWDLYVPAGTASSAVTIRAVDATNAVNTASSSYAVRATADVRASLVKLRGDSQSAAPGSQAPQSLRVALRDDSGNPLGGVEVRFSATTGAQVSPVTAITDSLGQAETFLRMPLTEGIVLANAVAMRQVATFSAHSTPSTLINYPKLTQSGDVPLGNGTATIAQKGSLLTAAASILRYFQNRGNLTMPNGVADPNLLNQFLKTLCGFDSQGNQICDGFVSPKDSQEQFVNLWRLSQFAGNNIDVSPESPELPVIRDLLAQESPVLLSMALTANGVPAGAHFVVAIGVSSDGSIQIHDPNPAFGRTLLTAYSEGFTLAGVAWKGVLTAAVRLLPRPPSPTGFVIVETASNTPASRLLDNAQLDLKVVGALNSPPRSDSASALEGPGASDLLSVTSQNGSCGTTVQWPSSAAVALTPQPSGATFKQRYCDGAQPVYQIDLSGSGAFFAVLTDLGNLGAKYDLAGGVESTFRATRTGQQLVVASQSINFSTRSVVNAATFSADMAPGGLIAIFGDGLAKPGIATKVEIADQPASVTAAFPFQINAQIPFGIAPGTQVLRVTSLFGVSERTIEIQPFAPAIFRLDPLPLGLDKTAVNKGATINQDAKLNLPSNPAARGTTVVVFGTGFGAINSGATPVTTLTPVTASLGGQDIPVSFAGLTPGFIGLYQVNVSIPVNTPPGLDLPIYFTIGGVASSPVEIAIQ